MPKIPYAGKPLTDIEIKLLGGPINATIESLKEELKLCCGTVVNKCIVSNLLNTLVEEIKKEQGTMTLFGRPCHCMNDPDAIGSLEEAKDFHFKLAEAGFDKNVGIVITEHLALTLLGSFECLKPD